MKNKHITPDEAVARVEAMLKKISDDAAKDLQEKKRLNDLLKQRQIEKKLQDKKDELKQAETKQTETIETPIETDTKTINPLKRLKGLFNKNKNKI